MRAAARACRRSRAVAGTPARMIWSPSLRRYPSNLPVREQQLAQTAPGFLIMLRICCGSQRNIDQCARLCQGNVLV
jgi:hypothetical protein